MKKITTLLLGIIVLCLPLQAFSQSPLTIKWEDLIPEEYRSDDLLANVSDDERYHVEWIIYLRQTLPEKITAKDEVFYKEMKKEMPKLKKKGIDVDKIIAERKIRETSLNSKLDGKQIRLAGYLLPLDFSGKTIRDFLLVPTIGACIHVPPPPPNQMVYATTEQPIKFDPNEMFKPIWATGRLTGKHLTKELFLGDGTGDVDIGYVLKVETIAPYKRPWL